MVHLRMLDRSIVFTRKIEQDNLPWRQLVKLLIVKGVISKEIKVETVTRSQSFL